MNFTDLKPGQMPYKERLLSLNLLPIAYDREIKVILLFCKAIQGYIDINFSNYISYNNPTSTRRGQTAG